MGGEVQRLATAWGTLTAAESRRAIETFLDGYINFAYRSLKSHRDGRTPEAHLDATESIPWALPLVFAVHRRVRHNKYLPWEVVQHPFGDHRLDNGRLLSLLNTIVATGDAEAQRHLFAVIEEEVRRWGFGNVLPGAANSPCSGRRETGPRTSAHRLPRLHHPLMSGSSAASSQVRRPCFAQRLPGLFGTSGRGQRRRRNGRSLSTLRAALAFSSSGSSARSLTTSRRCQ